MAPMIVNLPNSRASSIKIVLTEGSSFILYADDLLLIKSLPSVEDEHDLQKDCKTIETFYKNEHLQLNGKKTELLLASVAPGGASPLQIQIRVADANVEGKEEIKYLGILIDSRLTFVKHASKISGKARKMLGAIRRILFRWKLTKQIGLIYTTCIRPIVTYGIAVTYPRTKGGRRILERVNKIA
jgi:hypothetical protein